ncbi:MAG: hypothetical protein RIG62_09090 [Cyclobacteriaceae bacterium]
MNDKDFDALFKQAAEQHHVPYNPNAWVKMRRKLDRAAGTMGTSGKIITGLLLLFLLGGIVGVSVWHYGSTPELTSTEVIQTIENDSTAGKLVQSQTSETRQSASGSDQTGIQPETSETREDVTSTAQLVNEETGSDGEISEEAVVQDAPFGYEVSMQGFSQGNGIGYLSGNAIAEQAMRLGVPPVTPVAMDMELEGTAADIIPEEKPPLTARWRVSVGFSPDISAINLGEASQVGSNAVVGLEYFLFARLSVQAGVIFSNKVYEASGESYKPYPGYWKKYPMPNSIDAQCDVLDILINLRYYAFDTPKNRVFISGGVSSYLMLTEDYVYQYKGHGYQKPYSYEHFERNKNRHYFKVANLSLGYERALSKRWALQVEPFVKVPVAGVGFGKIKLSSTGMFMTLNYRLR